MKATRITRVALALAVVAIQAELVACTPKTGGSASSTPSTMSDAQIIAAGRQYAQCMREHGFPAYGDPEIKDGGLAFPDPQGVTEEQLPPAADACKQFLEPVPRSMLDAPKLSDADLAKLVRFAQCMRANGMPDWPDPKSDGTFPAAAAEKSQRMGGAQNTCKQYWDKDISYS